MRAYILILKGKRPYFIKKSYLKFPVNSTELVGKGLLQIPKGVTLHKEGPTRNKWSSEKAGGSRVQKD